MPYSRPTPLTIPPASTSFRILTIWLSVNRDFFIAALCCWDSIPENSNVVCFHSMGGLQMFLWSKRTGLKLHFIQPGKPIQNAFVESFNDRFRDGCLNQHWFQTLADASDNRCVERTLQRGTTAQCIELSVAC